MVVLCYSWRGRRKGGGKESGGREEGEARVFRELDLLWLGEGIKGRSLLVVRCDVDRERVTLPACPFWGRRQKKRKKLVRVVGLRGRWAGSGQVKDGLLFFFPFFSGKLLLLFLQHSVERRRGGFGKICKQVIKLDLDLKQFFKVCKY
jgi:hypothetical protein